MAFIRPGGGGAVVPPLNLQLTAEDVLTVESNAGAGKILRVDTRDPAVVGANMDAVEIYLNGSDGSSNEITGGAYNLRNLFMFSSVDSGTQTNLHRAMHGQVRATGNAVYSGVSGASLRGGHFAAIWNSTGTCAEMSGVQTNSSINTNGITTGLVGVSVGHRVLCDFTGSGNGSCTTGIGILSQSPGGTSAGTRTFTNFIGIDVENMVQSGVTNAWAIRTKTGLVQLGDTLQTDGGRVIKTNARGAGNYTVTSTDDLVLKTAITGGGDTVSLPSTAATGQRFQVKDASGNAGTNNITVDTVGAPNIDGAATAVINANYNSLTFIFDGTNYFII